MTSVQARQGYGHHGCSKCATDDPDADGNPTKCSTHSKAGQARLAERHLAQNQISRDRFEKERRKRAFDLNCQQAIRDIAAGHNDPRTLAQSIIDKLEGDPA